ncbi:hypothetical protein, partial [Olivibacter jilunii]|uniref:hypothetical protein n=1 Tax=Olivibacter jilunii TaxID=985016 RepID=UPI003F14DC63
DHRAERGNPKSGLLEHTVKQRKPKHGVRSFLAVILPFSGSPSGAKSSFKRPCLYKHTTNF